MWDSRIFLFDHRVVNWFFNLFFLNNFDAGANSVFISYIATENNKYCFTDAFFIYFIFYHFFFKDWRDKSCDISIFFSHWLKINLFALGLNIFTSLQTLIARKFDCFLFFTFLHWIFLKCYHNLFNSWRIHNTFVAISNIKIEHRKLKLSGSFLGCFGYKVGFTIIAVFKQSL